MVDVGTQHVELVPEGDIVLQAAIEEVVVEALDELLSKGILGVGLGFELLGAVVPELGVQFNIFAFGGILCLEVFVADGIDEAETLEVARGNEAYGVAGGTRVGVEGILGNGDLRVAQLELLAVGELHLQTAGHGGDVLPLNVDLRRIHRRQEGILSLEHGEGRELGDGLAIVAVLTVDGGIDRNNVAVTLHGVHVVAAVAMGITTRMAIFAGAARGNGSPALVRLSAQGILCTGHHVALVEEVGETLRIDSGRVVLVAAAGRAHRRAELTAGQPLFG